MQASKQILITQTFNPMEENAGEQGINHWDNLPHEIISILFNYCLSGKKDALSLTTLAKGIQLNFKISTCLMNVSKTFMNCFNLYCSSIHPNALRDIRLLTPDYRDEIIPKIRTWQFNLQLCEQTIVYRSMYSASRITFTEGLDHSMQQQVVRCGLVALVSLCGVGFKSYEQIMDLIQSFSPLIEPKEVYETAFNRFIDLNLFPEAIRMIMEKGLNQSQVESFKTKIFDTLLANLEREQPSELISKQIKEFFNKEIINVDLKKFDMDSFPIFVLYALSEDVFQWDSDAMQQFILKAMKSGHKSIIYVVLYYFIEHNQIDRASFLFDKWKESPINLAALFIVFIENDKLFFDFLFKKLEKEFLSLFINDSLDEIKPFDDVLPIWMKNSSEIRYLVYTGKTEEVKKQHELKNKKIADFLAILLNPQKDTNNYASVLNICEKINPLKFDIVIKFFDKGIGSYLENYNWEIDSFDEGQFIDAIFKIKNLDKFLEFVYKKATKKLDLCKFLKYLAEKEQILFKSQLEGHRLNGIYLINISFDFCNLIIDPSKKHELVDLLELFFDRPDFIKKFEIFSNEYAQLIQAVRLRQAEKVRLSQQAVKVTKEDTCSIM